MKKLIPLQRFLVNTIVKKENFLFILAILFSFSGISQIDTYISSSQVHLLNVAPVNSLRITSPTTVNPNALYSNVTTYTGSAFSNGGATNQAGNTITRLVADSLKFIGAPPYSVSGFVFSVSNLDASTVSARPRVRFYANDGPGGSPGTVITGFSFNPISFGPSSIGTYSASVTAFTVSTPAIWAGITFDDNTGTTGATTAQLNNLGQGIFNPIDRGSSTDTYFITTAAGSFLANNPAGSDGNFGGAPLANFGWEFVSATPLPIKLNNFSAQRNGIVNDITWSTFQELNINYFAIERSTDGQNFTKIGQVSSAGNSSTNTNYQFTDASPIKGINYYRLRIVDRDNNTKFSEIRSVRNEGNADFTIYPNPVKDVMKLEINVDRADKGVMIITDVSGKQVYSQNVTVAAGNNTFSVDISNMAQDAYIIKVQLTDDMIVKKFTKM